MKTSAVLLGSLLPAAAMAQNITFLTGLLQTLQGAGLSQLATVATQMNSSTVGQYLLANISNGSPHILFAPNNQACKSIQPFHRLDAVQEYQRVAFCTCPAIAYRGLGPRRREDFVSPRH